MAFTFGELAKSKTIGKNNNQDTAPTVVPGFLLKPVYEGKNSNPGLRAELSSLSGPQTEWHGKEKKVYELASKVSYHGDKMQEIFDIIKNGDNEIKSWAIAVLKEASYNPMSFESYESFKEILIHLMNNGNPKTKGAALDMASRKMSNEFGASIIEHASFIESLQSLMKKLHTKTTKQNEIMLTAAKSLFAYHTGAAYIG